MKSQTVSFSQHMQDRSSTRSVMMDILLALTPAFVASVFLFGPRTLMLTAVSVAACVLSEWAFRKILKRENTAGDLSAAVTGVLLVFSMPVGIHPLILILGDMIAVVAVKQMFGGIGRNLVNPALTARVILMAFFPVQMSTWVKPFYYLEPSDAVSTATPLGIEKAGTSGAIPSLFRMFLGERPGCLGETCALALILGGVYLICKKVISPIIPLCYLGTAAVISFLAGRNPAYDLLSGGLLLGAFFMATDYTTSPSAPKGMVIYAVGAGVLTMLIRIFGRLPDGVSFAVIIMNLLTPWMERLSKIRRPSGKTLKEK